MTALIIMLHIAGGSAVGGLYLGSLWWNARLFGRADRIGALLASMAARFALLGIVLTAASFEGAPPLLASTLSVFLARIVVLRGVRIMTA